MKIVLIDKDEGYQIGGISVYINRLAVYLKQHGYKVYILKFSNKKKKEKNTFFIPYYLAEKRSFIILPTETSLSLIKKYLNEIKPDVVYSPIGFSFLDFFLPSICHNLKIPIVGAWHIDFNRGVGSYQIIFKSLFLTYLSFCKQLDMLHVFSDKLAQFYMKRGVDREKILVLPNGVDPNLYKKNSTSIFAKTKQIKKGILFLGRLTLQKNPEVLIKSFLKLDQFEDTKLVLVGPGDLEDELKLKYSKDKRIIFTGLITNEKKKIDIINSCQIFVLPSRFEGMPLALLEAMSCQLACIASDAGSNRELLGKAGIILQINELDFKLSTVLKSLLKSSNLVDNIGKKARQRIMKSYSQETVFKRLSDNFKKTVRSYKITVIKKSKPIRVNESFLSKLDSIFERIKEF